MQRPRHINLDRSIVLLEPQADTVDPETGATIIGDRVRWPIRAARRAIGGDDSITNDTVVIRDRVDYTVRYQGGAAKRAKANWEIEDDGQLFRIITIFEAPGFRKAYLMIQAVAYD